MGIFLLYGDNLQPIIAHGGGICKFQFSSGGTGYPSSKRYSAQRPPSIARIRPGRTAPSGETATPGHRARPAAPAAPPGGTDSPGGRGRGQSSGPAEPPRGVPRGAGLRPATTGWLSGWVIRRENRRRRRPPSSSPRPAAVPPLDPDPPQARLRGVADHLEQVVLPPPPSPSWSGGPSPIYTGYVMQRASPSKHPRQGLCQCMHSLRRGCPVPPYPAEGRLSTTRSHPRLSVS